MTETNLEETKLEEENQDNGRNEGLEKEKEDRKENGREGRSRFWKGALAGSLVTAFVVLAAVGMAAGIWIMGRQTQETRQAVLPEPEGEYGLDMGRLAPKLGYMQQLIDQYYLFDEDEERENPEDWSIRAMYIPFRTPIPLTIRQRNMRVSRKAATANTAASASR